MEQQLGIRLTIALGPNEVRTLRGITILVHEQRGLCRKTRQSIPPPSAKRWSGGLRSATNYWTKVVVWQTVVAVGPVPTRSAPSP